MTESQLQAMSRTGETGEIVFRGAAGGAVALPNKQIDAAVNAWFATADTYDETDFRTRMRAAIAAATGARA
jgi:hypothetical protein